MSETPTEPPKMAYVVMCNSQPCFSADTFERASERAVTLMKSNVDSDCYYRIVRVEAE